MGVAAVKAHVTHVLKKLELNNRVQIALLAHDAGWPESRGTCGAESGTYSVNNY
jgi:hypothetical protein